MERFNFGEKKAFKSTMGGICTTILVVLFLVTCFIQGYPIYKKRSPKFQTKKVKVDPDEVIYLNETKSIPFFLLWDGVSYF